MRLGSEFLAVLDVAGCRRPLERGTALYRAGELNAEFFVIVCGRVALVDKLGSAGERVVGVLDER